MTYSYKRGGHKYGNNVINVDGEVFHSKWEYECWCDLKAQESAGEISNLARQYKLTFFVKNHEGGVEPLRLTRNLASAVFDFIYTRNSDGMRVIRDAKGMWSSSAPTCQIFNWKAALANTNYGYEVEIITKKLGVKTLYAGKLINHGEPHE